MRRLLVAATALSLALAPAIASPASAKRIRNFSLGASGTAPGGGGYFIMGGVTIDETVGGPAVTHNNFTVAVYNGIGGFANASGPLSFDIDPTLTSGTLAGTIGGITVDLSFLSTAVDSSVPPTAIEIVPTSPQEGSASTTLNRRGRVNGSLTSVNTGPISAVNGVAFATQTISVIVTA